MRIQETQVRYADTPQLTPYQAAGQVGTTVSTAARAGEELALMAFVPDACGWMAGGLV